MGVMGSTGNPRKACVSIEVVRALLAVLLRLLWGYGDEKEKDTSKKKKNPALNQLLDFKPTSPIHKQARFCRYSALVAER